MFPSRQSTCSICKLLKPTGGQSGAATAPGLHSITISITSAVDASTSMLVFTKTFLYKGMQVKVEIWNRVGIESSPSLPSTPVRSR